VLSIIHSVLSLPHIYVLSICIDELLSLLCVDMLTATTALTDSTKHDHYAMHCVSIEFDLRCANMCDKLLLGEQCSLTTTHTLSIH
jgi:hypothetical protein